MLPFTVFTPTFNRAATLPRVYESLRAQTVSPDTFEWLIIDDGSSDGTRELVAQWAAHAPFAIRYAWQPNAGKHRAWNHGVAEARGELFVGLDSDDACVPEALARFDAAWGAVSDREKARLAGVLALCNDASGRPIGPLLPAALERVDYGLLQFGYGWSWETFTATRTDLLRAFPMPQGPDGQLVPEGALWHQLSRSYQWVALSERLRIYYTGDAGRPDQLSQRRPLRRDAPGMALAIESTLTHSFRYFRAAPFQFARSAVHMSRFSLLAREPVLARIGRIEPAGAKLLCLAALPASYAAYALDKGLGRA